MAVGNGAAGAFITSKGFGPFNKISTGVYHLPLAGTPPPDDNCIPIVNLGAPFQDNGLFIGALISGGIVEITIVDNSGGATPTDAVFTITVANNS
jgi:hypothetical protein